MVDADRAEFALAVGAMCESFGHDATPPFIRGYWIGLSDLDIESVQNAVARAIRECEKLPKPVELRRLAGEATDEQAATIAWDDVVIALPRGPYKHIDFSNRLINAVIRNMGGWPNFLGRFTDADSEKWVRQEFLRTYRNLARGVSDEACEPLAGLAQVVSSGNGVELARPLLIECKSRCSETPRLQHSGGLKRIG